jgi:hypothetical protein
LLHNAYLSYLILGGLVDTFLLSNKFKFQTDETDISSLSINSTIDELDLFGYDYKLDETLLHPLVFERIQLIEFYGTVGSIQLDMFESFAFLSSLKITVANLGNFFHEIGIEWTGYLTPNSTIAFRHNYVNSESLLYDLTYSYPNRDLCIFADFPHNKSVIPFLNANLTDCTNTIAWLTKDYKNYNLTYLSQQLDDDSIFPLLINSICWSNDKQSPNMTLIKSKINNCQQLQQNQLNDSIERTGSYKTYFDYYEIQYVFEFVVDFITFVFIPFACIIGFVLNLRIIWTVRKHSKVELKEDFYQFMSLNSKFNCVFCLIYVLYPINYCQAFTTGYFCSAIFNTTFSQIIKIVFIAYFGEAVKMCSNIFYIFITINRYMLIGKEHSAVLENISKWEIKRVIAVSIVFSLLINIGHCFQYRINNGWGRLVSAYYFVQGLGDTYPA